MNGLLRIGPANLTLPGVLALFLSSRGRAKPVRGEKYAGSTAVVKVIGK